MPTSLLGRGPSSPRQPTVVHETLPASCAGTTTKGRIGVPVLRARLRSTSWDILLAALAMFAACAGIPQSPPPESAPTGSPNILLILADDLGYGDLGVYGSSTLSTPNLDRLAWEGIRFTSFYANSPICSPTRVAILTGRYPQRFGLYNGLGVDSTWGLPAHAATLPRLLRDAGYETMHVGKWHVGHAREAYRPLLQGFDGFFGFDHAHHLPKTYRDPRLRRNREPEQVRPGYLTDLLAAEAETFLRHRTESKRPFFLNLWTFSPHKPLEPPPRWADRYDDSVEGRFAAMVKTLDEAVGRLLSALEETGLTDNTVVVFSSDNGGADTVHGGRNGPFRGGKNDLLEGGIRVPLIVRWPGRVTAGAVSDALVASFDLFPTLAELAGVDLAGVPVDGRNLTPLLAGARDDFTGPLHWDDVHAGRGRFAVRRGPWKLRSEKGKTTLHDVRADPGETSDLATRRPEIVAELQEVHRTWRAGLPPNPDR